MQVTNKVLIVLDSNLDTLIIDTNTFSISKCFEKMRL